MPIPYNYGGGGGGGGGGMAHLHLPPMLLYVKGKPVTCNLYTLQMYKS